MTISLHTWNVCMCLLDMQYMALYQPPALARQAVCETVTLRLAAANNYNRCSLLFDESLKLLNIYCIFIWCKRLHVVEAIKKSHTTMDKLTCLLILDKYLFNIRLKEKESSWKYILQRKEETPGLGLCAEYVWVVIILIDRRPQCDWRWRWWIRFIMLWSLGMNYCSAASPVVKLSFMFSRMGCLAMEAQRTITMWTACSDMSLLVNGFAYNVPRCYVSRESL